MAKDTIHFNFPAEAQYSLTSHNHDLKHHSFHFSALEHPDNETSHPGSRKRRSAQAQRYMEVMLVADDSVVQFHGEDLVEQYLLTQMSIVSILVYTVVLHISDSTHWCCFT